MMKYHNYFMTHSHSLCRGNFDNDDAFKPGDNVWTNPPAETENNSK